MKPKGRNCKICNKVCLKNGTTFYCDHKSHKECHFSYIGNYYYIECTDESYEFDNYLVHLIRDSLKKDKVRIFINNKIFEFNGRLKYEKFNSKEKINKIIMLM